MSNPRDVVVLLFILAVAEAFLIYLAAPQYVQTYTLTTFIGVLAVFNIGVYVSYGHFVYPHFVSPLRDLPSPKSNFLVGNFRDVMKRPVGSKFAHWDRTIPNGGAIKFLGLLKEDRVLITSPEALKVVLSEHSYDYEKPARLREFLTRILGHGLLMVEGNEHRFQRKHLTPAFSVKQIRGLYPTFWEKSGLMVDQIQSQIVERGPIVELNDWATRATLDIIGAAGLGKDFGSLRDPNDELVQKYNDLLEPTTEKGIYFGLSMVIPKNVLRLLPWRLHGDLDRTIADLNSYALNIVHQRQAEMKKIEKSQETHATGTDILTILVQSGDFKDTELADQFLTFIAAGHETTSSSLSWVGYLMATNQEAQKKLRDEIRESLPSLLTAKTPYPSEVDDLPYLNAVCNETLRLYPAVPATMREAIRDTEIPIVTDTGVIRRHIPKGTRIALCPWANNRSVKIWGSDADDFVPERWLGEGKANTGGQSTNYAQMTFLHGPRSCIGQGFARSELKCLVAALVGRFEMTMANPDEEVFPGGVITTKPANGMHLHMTPLEGW